jgi:hypothetical protein
MTESDIGGAGRQLAQLNVGRLVAETGDPRVAEFMVALDRITGLGKRLPGLVWMMEGSGGPGTGNTGTRIDDDPRHVVNLTVWESVEALESFVWNTVHRLFYQRRREWFEAMGERHMVMWWVPAGHRPTLDEGLQRLADLRANGNSAQAFGWDGIEAARLWRIRACGAVAAE